jgi:hypothetical protein
MDDLQERFGKLIYDIAQDMQNDGYFFGSRELGDGYQTFLRDILRGQLPKAQLPMALYNLTKVIARLTKRNIIVLIDEYDTPTSYAVQYGYFPDVCP